MENFLIPRSFTTLSLSFKSLMTTSEKIAGSKPSNFLINVTIF